MLSTGYKHIVLDNDGTAYIDGTSYKVRMLILDHLAHGWSPQELQWQHPDLTLAQVYSALAYYAEHRAEMDRDIEERLKKVDEVRAQAGPSLRQKLADKGLL
ncbi:MAG: DUF433 domain-containing protein [Candidatus Xenobia bacterium]